MTSSLDKIHHGIKSNRFLRESQHFWQVNYFDRYIHNAEYFEKTVNYIELNPLKAGLFAKPSDWKYSLKREQTARASIKKSNSSFQKLLDFRRGAILKFEHAVKKNEYFIAAE